MTCLTCTRNMDAQHDNMSHGQEQYLNHARNDQGKAGDGDSESASCWKGLIKSQPDLVMPVFSNQDRDSLCIDPSTRPSHTHHVLGVNRVSEAASAPRISEEDGQSSRDRKDSIHVAGTARSGEDLALESPNSVRSSRRSSRSDLGRTGL